MPRPTGTPPRPFRVSDAALAALGAGRPDAATLDTLRRAQLSRNLLLLREIRRSLTDTPAWYTRLTTAPPAEADRLISDPMTGLWAAHTLREGHAPPLTHGGKVLTVTDQERTLTVRMDDTDPLRHLLGLEPSAPLSPGELEHWRRCLEQSWRILVRRHPAAASTLAAVLRVVVPVRPDPSAEGISATSAEAFGAVAMSMPADATAMATGLLHETQHSVLNAVNLLFELVEPGGPRGYSPWRDDPRPAMGVLHGAYAYLAVTRFWRAEAGAGTGGIGAAFEFARWRAAVVEAAEDLLAGGRLTAAGTRLVRALLDEARPWLAEPVEPEAARLAELARQDHRLRWRLRNRTVPGADAAELGRAWRAGQPPPDVSSVLAPASGRALADTTRLRLMRAWLTAAEQDQAAAEEGRAAAGRDRPAAGVRGPAEAVPCLVPEAGPAGQPGARGTAADVACARGDQGTAASAYEMLLGVDRTDDHAWSGLALVSPHLALRRRPEVVKAAALAVPEAAVTDLAAWLSQAPR